MSTFPLRHWRLAPSVTAILALPVALALALGALLVGDYAGRLDATAGTEQRTRLLLSATLLAHDLENERDTLARDGGRTTEELARLRADTDTSVNALRATADALGPDPSVSEPLAAARKALDGLSAARGGDLGGGSVAAVTAYSDIVRALLDLHVAAGRDVPGGARPGALQSLVTGKLALSGQRAVLGAVLAKGERPTAEQQSFLRARQAIAHLMLGQFGSATTDDADRTAFAAAADTSRTDALLDRALTPGAATPSRSEWSTAANEAVERLHTAEVTLLNRSLKAAEQEHASAYRSLVLHLAAIAVALLATALVAVLVARRILRRIGHLRRSALKAAAALPVLVRQMSVADAPERLRLEVPPVDSGSRDEIGDLERAFDEVVREAVHQTARQLTLRTSVHETLATVSRRGDVLVQRQLGLLSGLQMAEQDPGPLGVLFQLDHLATRIRRHGDSVLILAGERTGRCHFENAPLVEVVRAAAAEVEDFTRIKISGVPQATVAAHAVHDLIHLMAELLENATRFSGPELPVRVRAEAGPRGEISLVVTDGGTGIEPALLDKLNFLLQAPPSIESMRGGHIGLYVVNRLAGRHAVRVRLDSDASGTRAVLVLPAPVVTTVAREPHTEGRP